jgi:hypothetical protein
MVMSRNLLWVVLVGAVLIAAMSTAALAEPEEKPAKKNELKQYEIGLIGDFPYDPAQQQQAHNLFEELNSEDLAFIAHAGDIKSGKTACTDDVYWREFRRFESSRNPLVYTPGDNEWTDCHHPPNPSPEEADPLDRLSHLRETFFSDGASLGREEMPLQRQSEEYPENARWSVGGARGVTFATVHVVGSNNNRPTTENPTVGDEEEWRARNEANIAWLEQTFWEAERRDSEAVMVVIQANIFEGDDAVPSGFAEFKEVLRRETIAFGNPVVLVHGDSHYFRVDKPLYTEEGGEARRVLNFTRVETFGGKDVHWVRATVDIRDEDLFSFDPEIVEENL